MKLKLTLPSYITLTRFILVPWFVHLFLKGEYALALTILVIAGITDLLDGFIARKFHMRSKLGSLLDPMADKFLMIISFVFLAREGFIPWSITGLVLFKDIGISVVVVWLNLLRIKLLYRPTILSKLTTTSQIILLSLSFAEAMFLRNPVQWIPYDIRDGILILQTYFLLIVAAMTFAASVQYAYLGYKFYRYGERKQKEDPKVP